MAKLGCKAATGLMFILLVACGGKPKFISVNFESELELKVGESLFKGDIAFLNGTHQIPYDCPLDLKASKIKSGMKFASFFSLRNQKTTPTLGDLEPKYILTKKKNENIIYGIKQGDTLAFRLIDFPN